MCQIWCQLVHPFGSFSICYICYAVDPALATRQLDRVGKRPTHASYRSLSRRLDRCDRVIQNESRDPFGGNVYYVTMQITFLTRKFRNGERNLHCDVVHITTKWVSSLTLDCNGVFAIKAYRQRWTTTAAAHASYIKMETVSQLETVRRKRQCIKSECNPFRVVEWMHNNWQ